MKSLATAALSLAILAGTAMTANAQAFKLTSPDIKEGGTVPMAHVMNAMGCTGGGKSPALAWSGAPEGTKGYALTVYDPDAPTGSGFWHWVVANIPASTTSLPGGITPDGQGLPAGAIQTRTDGGGGTGYLGPCPPVGDKPHRYIFSIIALKTDKLDVNADASGAYVGFNIHFAELGRATLSATFGR
jgi:Raf kinase inhibitor-like YbhB/YbcL family protein